MHKVNHCWALCSSGMLHSINWYLLTDVLGQPISPIFKGQAIHRQLTTNLHCVTSQKSKDLIYNVAEA
jgi:hypothetical protein